METVQVLIPRNFVLPDDVPEEIKWEHIFESFDNQKQYFRLVKEMVEAQLRIDHNIKSDLPFIIDVALIRVVKTANKAEFSAKIIGQDIVEDIGGNCKVINLKPATYHIDVVENKINMYKLEKQMFISMFN